MCLRSEDGMVNAREAVTERSFENGTLVTVIAYMAAPHHPSVPPAGAQKRQRGIKKLPLTVMTAMTFH